MKIKIYQINLDRDEKRIAFFNLKYVKASYNGKIPLAIYDCVFEGKVKADNLEDIFRMFNIEHPDGYTGRSLSVSDVVEVVSNSNRSKFYYCDSFGFKRIKFKK